MVEAYGLYNFNGWTQIVQLPVFKQIMQMSQLTKKNRKT